MKRFENIIGEIIKEKLDIAWGALGIRISSLKIMDKEFLGKIVKSGCKNMDIGVESGSDRLLKLVKKGTTVNEIVDVNKKISEFAFNSKYTFIVGMPTETEDELKSSVGLAIRLIKDNKKVYTPFFIYAAYPGTEMYEIAIKNGMNPPKNLEEWSNFSFTKAYKNYPWLTKKRVKMIRNLAFSSNFANKNIKLKLSKKHMKILFDMYQPFAKFRFEHNFYKFPVERMLLERFMN
jgi:radical SAM superfamily enzyme YgiQ (UPF0313 family)